MPPKPPFNSRLAIDRARFGDSSDADMRKDIKRAGDLGLSSAVKELQAILQSHQGCRATRQLSQENPVGSARWAFAQLEAAPVTPYSWSALTANGDVVVNLWDDARDFDPITFQPIPWVRERANRKTGTRTEFFKHLETAMGSRGGVLRVTLSTAIDRNVRPVKRTPGKTRPWFNEDGSPVLIRLVELVMPSPQDIAGYWRGVLAEPDKRPLSPFAADR